MSDRRKKENFTQVNRGEILSIIELLPMAYWNYKEQGESIVHVGPMAQDFYSGFGLGESDTTITTTDIDGVTLIGIQGGKRRI